MEALRIAKLIENGEWRWVDCLWRTEKYSYGILHKNSQANNKNEVTLLRGERRMLGLFWEEYRKSPKKLLDDAANSLATDKSAACSNDESLDDATCGNTVLASSCCRPACCRRRTFGGGARGGRSSVRDPALRSRAGAA